MWWVLLVYVHVSALYAAPAETIWIVQRQTRDTPIVKSEGPLAKPDLYSVQIESAIRLRYSTTLYSYRIANPTKQAQEVLFEVILPETAYISSFLMVIDGEIYRASVKEKETAQREYNAAVAGGQTAAQVASSARDSNKFQVSVNLEPGSKGTFNLTYEEFLTRRSYQYEQVLNLQFKQIVKDVSVRVNIMETSPPWSIRIKELRNNSYELFDLFDDIVTVQGVGTDNVRIEYHPTPEQQLEVSPEGLRQFVVQYNIDVQNQTGSGGVVHVIDGYFVHFFAPSVGTLPKHVVFILDVSGSMDGEKLVQTKEAMHRMLYDVQNSDYISVIDFSSFSNVWNLADARIPPKEEESIYITDSLKDVEEIKTGLRVYQATSSNVDRVKLMVEALTAKGSTNINDALLDGIKLVTQFQSITSTPVTPLIVFLTDGQATSGEINADKILANLRKGDPDRLASVFSLGFGEGPDFEFLKKISVQNRGFARRIYADADATLQLRDFFRDIASPELTNVEFKYSSDTVDSYTSVPLPTFFQGGELVVAGKLKESNEIILPESTVEGVSASGQYSQAPELTYIWKCFPGAVPHESESVKYVCPDPIDPPTHSHVEVTPSASTSPGDFMERLWSYLTIKDLLRKADLNETDTKLKEKALQISLKYGFVTPLTSLLVVKPNSIAVAETEPAVPESASNGVRRPGLVPHALPVPFAFVESSLGDSGLAATHPPAKYSTTTWEPSSTGNPELNLPSTEVSERETTVSVLETSALQVGFINRTHIEFIKEGVTHLVSIGEDRPASSEEQECSYVNNEGRNRTGICVAPWRCRTHLDTYYSRQGQYELSEEEAAIICFDRQQFWGYCCQRKDVTDVPPKPLLEVANPDPTEYAPEPTYPSGLEPIRF